MIRILHFAWAVNPNDIIDVVLRRLDRSEFDPHLLIGSQIPSGLASVPYPIKSIEMNFGKSTYPRMFASLSKEIRRLRPDIVQAHHFHENVVTAVAARTTSIPAYIIGRHYSDHIHFLTRGLKKRLYLGLEAYCNRTADAISVPTKHVADILFRQGVPRQKVRIVPFGVDVVALEGARAARHEMRARISPEGSCIVMCCGRLNPEKGFHHVIEAAATVLREHDARFVLVGDGPERERLVALATDLGLLDNITFAGWQKNPLEWMAAADVLVNPAYCESFCQVMVEALAVGTPVIMTPVGAAPDVIGDNKRGRLVPFGDSAAIAGAINELLGNEELRAELAAAGLDYVTNSLTPVETARQNESLYRDVLERA